MDTNDQKKLMKMDRIHLMELLQDLSRQNEELALRVSQMEAGNARLILSAREAAIARDEALKELEAAKAAQVDLTKLPSGSFAEAIAQSMGIAEKTQAAADAYMAQIKASAEASQAQIEQQLADAHQQADALLAETRDAIEQQLAAANLEAAEIRAQADETLAAAKAQAEQLVNEANAAKASMDSEVQGMSSRLQAEMQRITSFMQELTAPEVSE